MNGEQSTRPGPRPDHPALRLDAACDRFEVAWRQGRRPRIEDYLVEAVESERVGWLRYLLQVELEHRRGAGEAPTRGNSPKTAETCPSQFKGSFRAFFLG